MKALEFLNKNKALMLEAKEAYENEDCGDYDYDSIILTINEIDEAIEELEALESRNCSNCKHSWEPNNQVIFRFYCEEINTRTHGDFYCNRWEAK